MLSVNDENGTAEIVGIPIDYINDLSSIRINLPLDLTDETNRMTGKRCMKEAIKKLVDTQGAVPMLHIKDDLKVNL